MRSLRRDEAAARAALARVMSIKVELDLTRDGDTFASRTTMVFDASASGQTFADVRPDRLLTATLNGADVSSALVDGRLALSVVAGRNELVVDAIMRYSHDGEGLVRHVDPADGRAYVYAMSFLDAAPRWLACFDQPDLKAPFAVEVRCPPDWTVAGNGFAARHAPGHWTTTQPKPIPTYTATLVAGPYHTIRAEHDGIPLALHARSSLAAELDRDAAALFAHTARCFDECHRLFGARYPWGEYHQAFVPDFNAGAMENPGCVTFRDSLVFRSSASAAELGSRDRTIAHELAHMWFGDLVTMRWWDDLWLNESFAEYVGHRVCAELGDHSSWPSFGIERKSWGYAADRRPSTHPVAGDGATGAVDAAAALTAFDGISYAKGAAVLRQLAARLGDEVFLAGLRAHIASHAYGNATLSDLLRAWRDAGAGAAGVDIDAWSQSWLRTTGLDTLRVEGDSVWRDGTREHAITVADYGSGERRRVSIDSDVTEIDLAGSALDDFALPDADDLTWAKIAFPRATWQRMPQLLPTLDATARVVVWNALQLAVADAETSVSAAVDIVAAALPAEDSAVVVSAIMTWSQRIARTHTSDPDVAARLAGCARALVARATPDTVLVAARALLAVTEDVALLRAWSTGAVPNGVELDHDLRWRLLVRLCELGASDPDEIDRGLAADESSEGRRRAAQCRAALPLAESKDAAWRLLMRDGASANSILYATAQGFWQPGQRELTAPYVARYFDEVAATARLRSGWVVGRLAADAYPWTAVHLATLTASETVTQQHDLDPGIRRAIIDGADDLRRALVARQTFDE